MSALLSHGKGPKAKGVALIKDGACLHFRTHLNAASFLSASLGNVWEASAHKNRTVKGYKAEPLDLHVCTEKEMEMMTSINF